MIVRKGRVGDAAVLVKLDRQMYTTGFQMDEEAFRKLARGDKGFHKGHHKLAVAVSAADQVQAYMIYMQMPITHAGYIVSLGGSASGRTMLIDFLLETYAAKARRFYTHAKPEWGTALLKRVGFKDVGPGNMADEVVPFVEDISKLTVWEKVVV